MEAYGGEDAAGIGGGEDGNGGTIVISGGYVYAQGNDWGAGIGAGEDGIGADFRIYGGIVEAVAGSKAAAKNGCAIGSEDDVNRKGSISFADQMCVFAGQNRATATLFSPAERRDAWVLISAY